MENTHKKELTRRADTLILNPMPQPNAADSKAHERVNQHSQDAAEADEAKAIPLAQFSNNHKEQQ